MKSGHLTEFLSHHVGMFSILIERLEFESKLHLRFQLPADGRTADDCPAT